MAYDSLLMCKKCHSNLVVPKRITVKKLTVYVWARCSHCKKEVKFTLPLPQVHEWVDPIAHNFFRCPKCGVTGVVTREMTDSNFTKVRLYCPSCQRAYAKVANNSVYTYLHTAHYNQMKPQAAQPSAPAYFVPVAQAPITQPPTAPPAPPTPVAPPTPPAPVVRPTPPVPAESTLKKCTNCNAVLTSNASFCRKCGVPVETETDQAPRCPFCGATLSEKAKKCPKCSSEVRCPKCDALFHANARFCIKCGETIKGQVEEVEAPKVICHFCSAPLELDQKICPECGKPVTCPKCGNHLKSGVRFCNKCGENVSEITMPSTDEEEEEEAEFDEDLESPERLISCPKCHAKMDENYRYCTICGTELEKEE